MKEFISLRKKELPGTQMIKLVHLAEEAKGVISLGIGEPDFRAPRHIREAVKRALDDEKTNYSPVAGVKELKEAISRKLRKENKINAESNQIIVTCGSTEAIFLSFATLLNPGEDILIPDPSFLSYRPQAFMLGGYPVPIPLKEEDGFSLTGEMVTDAIRDPNRTKALVLCNPSNPTGTVMSRKALEEIADVAVEKDLFVVVDEAYEHFVYDTKHVSFASLNGMAERTVTLQSFSKTYAMPGLRVGYAVGPRPIIKAMTELHIYTTLAAPTPNQYGALAALRGLQKSVETMRREYDRRRKLICKRIREVGGLSLPETPKGAFYTFPSVHFGMGSFDTAAWLLREARVVTMPGTEFGRGGEGFIRFSYATSYEKIGEAFDQIEKAAKRRRHG